MKTFTGGWFSIEAGNTMRLYVFYFREHMEYHFAVAAESEAAAKAAVAEEVADLRKFAGERHMVSSWPLGYEMEIFAPGVVATFDNAERGED